MKKINVAVIFGGTNTEHEVSLVSARAIIQNLNPEKYQILPVMITKANQWLTPKSFLADPTHLRSLPETTRSGITVKPQEITAAHQIDVFFPVLHGPYGEDGTIQGLLEMMPVAYVGCGVLASAICMDKDIQKRLCLQAGLPVVPYQVVTSAVVPDPVSFPCFVKPANQGSSVGVTKVHRSKDLKPALIAAFKLDTKVLIETAVPMAREIECAILGTTEHPEASVLGEVIPSNEFYDYNAKYIDGQSQAIIPARLPTKLAHAIQSAAQKAFIVCGGYGLARVDFLVPKEGRGEPYYLSELNTLPGFTTISMYPKLWQASGLKYAKLLDRLIDLALNRHQQKSKLKLSYQPKSAWFD
ncbi:D-alanine--D-alanine ligase A [Microgenomates group bacterium RBG_16_45_19]|nr:MAG: D-alanine--D-alanine ligase A [Microgenomates group bacterium RBG_16_45_19]